MAFCCPRRNSFFSCCSALTDGAGWLASGIAGAVSGACTRTGHALTDAGTSIDTFARRTAGLVVYVYAGATNPKNRTAVATGAAGLVTAPVAAAAASLLLDEADTPMPDVLAGAATGLAIPLYLSLSTPRNILRTVALGAVAASASMAASVSIGPTLVGTATGVLAHALVERLAWGSNNQETHWSNQVLPSYATIKFLDITTKSFSSMSAFIIAFFLNEDLIKDPQLFWGLALALMGTTATLSLSELASEAWLSKDASLTRALAYSSQTVPGLLMMFGSLFGELDLISGEHGPTEAFLAIAALAALTRLINPDPSLMGSTKADILRKRAADLPSRPTGRAKLGLLGTSPLAPTDSAADTCCSNTTQCADRMTFPFRWLFSLVMDSLNASQSVPLGIIMLVAALRPQAIEATEQSDAATSIISPLLTLGIINSLYAHLQLKRFLEERGCCGQATARILRAIHLLTSSLARWGSTVVGVVAPAAGVMAIIRDQTVAEMLEDGQVVVPPFIGGIALTLPATLAVLRAVVDIRNAEYGGTENSVFKLRLCGQAARQIVAASSRTVVRWTSSRRELPIQRQDDSPDSNHEQTSDEGISAMAMVEMTSSRRLAASARNLTAPAAVTTSEQRRHSLAARPGAVAVTLAPAARQALKRASIRDLGLAPPKTESRFERVLRAARPTQATVFQPTTRADKNANSAALTAEGAAV